MSAGILKAAAIALCAAFGANNALAVTLEAPKAASASAEFTYAELDPLAEIAVFGAITGFDGIADITSAELTLLFGYSLASPPDGAEGVFSIDKGSDLLLTGEVGAITEIDGGLQLALSGLDGTEAGRFAPVTVATILFEGFSGLGVLATLTDVAPFNVAVEIGRLPTTTAPSPVPLPAGLPLLLSGMVALGLFGARGRRRAAHVSPLQ